MPNTTEPFAYTTKIEIATNASYTALAWVCLYSLNGYLFDDLFIDDYVSWVFLPAALRIVSVLLAGYAGALGLFIGALITNQPALGTNLTESIVLSALSALGPIIAVGLCLRACRIPNTLIGLKWWHLCVVAVAGALCNVVPTRTYLWAAGKAETILSESGPMLVGDLLGTLVVLALASFLAKLAEKLSKKQ